MQTKVIGEYYASNREAIEKMMTTFHLKSYQDLDEYLKSNPYHFGDLRNAGLKCSMCGGRVTESNFRFVNFNADVRCYNCQK